MMTINNKILKLQSVLLTQHIIYHAKICKISKYQKSDTPLWACTPPWGKIFLSEVLIVVSSISYLSMVEKATWFFDGKKSIFENNKVKNVKNLEILQSKRDFFQFFLGDNFWYIYGSKLTFSTYVLCWEYCRKINNQTVIGQKSIQKP